MESRSPQVWPPLLDWSDGRHWADEPAPCVLCGTPTRLLSDRHKPCHKVCAEEWFEKHPEAWAAYEARAAGSGGAGRGGRRQSQNPPPRAFRWASMTAPPRPAGTPNHHRKSKTDE